MTFKLPIVTEELIHESHLVFADCRQKKNSLLLRCKSKFTNCLYQNNSKNNNVVSHLIVVQYLFDDVSQCFKIWSDWWFAVFHELVLFDNWFVQVTKIWVEYFIFNILFFTECIMSAFPQDLNSYECISNVE